MDAQKHQVAATPFTCACQALVAETEIRGPMIQTTGIIDYSKFALRIPEADMLELPQILQAVPRQHIQEMQLSLAKVWHR